MKIGILHYAPFPWNRGIHLVAGALRNAGHEVIVYCPEGRLGNSGQSSVTVVRRAVGTRLPAYADPRWLNWLVRRLRRDNVDVLWARDLPIMPFAVLAGRILRLPVCFDMRENFPAAFAARRRNRAGLAFRMVHQLLRLAERVSVRLADQVFVVVEEQQDRLISMGVPEKRVTVNMTTPDDEFLSVCPAPALDRERRWLSVVYAGHFFSFRGLGLVLEAVALARRRGGDIRLTIAGGGGKGDEEMLGNLLERTRELGIEEAVSAAGWVDPAALPEFLAAHDVGIIANELSHHTETTIPGKLFEYMACGLIVISSDISPVRRIIEKEKIGRVFRPYTAEALAEQLLDVALMSTEDRHATRSRSWQAAREQYNWTRQSKGLVQAVSELDAAR